MTSRNLFDSLRGIDDGMILDAAPDKHRNRRVMMQLRRGAVAACLALTILTGSALTVLSLGQQVDIGGVTRRYKYFGTSLNSSEKELMLRWEASNLDEQALISDEQPSTSGEQTPTTDEKAPDIFWKPNESMLLWRWEYRTVYEKYLRVTWNEISYRPSNRVIDIQLLGETLGTCTAQGKDSYTDTVYTETFEVRAIGNISPEKVVALGLDGTYYVYQCADLSFPATWGEVLDAYDLENVLPLSRFHWVQGYKQDTQYYAIADDAYIWQVLSACRDAQWVEDTPSFMGNKRYISFTATSEELGVYKKVFYVTEDGYIRTNIFNFAYTFHIGEEASCKIIDYVTANAEPTESEPYLNTVTGTLVEIGDGYILVDDAILCAAFERNKVFRVLTDDLRISRVIDTGHAKVGDIVVVSFTDDVIVADGDYVIDSATEIDVGYLSGGTVSVPE